MPRRSSISRTCTSLALVCSVALACSKQSVSPEMPDAEPPAESGEVVATPELEPEPSEAVAPPPEVCADLDPDACGDKGANLLLTSEPERGFDPLKWSCEQGVGLACSNLFWAYERGILSSPPEGLLVEVNERGCEVDWGQSCTLLGTQYQEGDGVEQDLERAAQLLTKACELEQGHGCLMLGISLQEAGDVDGAGPLLERACELDTSTCRYTGVFLLQVSGDGEAAVARFQRGCDGGDEQSCFNLGAVLGMGKGVPQDLAAGEQWMRKACELGHQEGCSAAEELRAQQDPTMIANANVSMGEVEVNGMKIRDFQCRITGGGGLLGSMALAGLLADKKKALSKCAPKGAAPVVRWDFVGGKTKVILVDDPSEKVAACVKKVMKSIPATMEAQCRAMLLVGKAAGAEAAANAR